MRIAGYQLAAEECWSEEQFRNKIFRAAKIVHQTNADVLVLPEGLGMMLSFAKECSRVQQLRFEDSIKTLSVRSKMEQFVDWLMSKIKLRFIGELWSQRKISRIIRSACSDAAKTYRLIIVAGSEYIRYPEGIVNISAVFDVDGSLIAEIPKRQPLEAEKAFGVVPQIKPFIVNSSKGTFAVMICNDVNFPEYWDEVKASGVKIVCVPSAGWRPYPNYPWDDAVDAPQIKAAQKTGLAFIRVYQCGWEFPVMYYDGHTSIAYPNGVVDRVEHTNQETYLITNPII